LLEERLPEGWESRIRRQMGLTMATFNFTVLPVELGINEKKYLEEKATNDANTDGASSSVPKPVVPSN
jgi:hypothetical protein